MAQTPCPCGWNPSPNQHVVSKETPGPIVPSRPWGVLLPLLRAREAHGEGSSWGSTHSERNGSFLYLLMEQLCIKSMWSGLGGAKRLQGKTTLALNV